MPHYVPEKGDFLLLSFDPQFGHEQMGRRPGLVVSGTLFNRHTGLVMVCPINNTFRNVPFHVKVPEGSSLTGYIMVDQLKSVDYVSRRAEFVDRSPQAVVDEVLAILDACLYEGA